MTTVLKPRGLIKKSKKNHRNKKNVFGEISKTSENREKYRTFFLFSLSSLNTTPLTCCKKPCRDGNSALLCPTCRLQTLPFKLRRQGVKVKSEIVHVGKNVLKYQILNFFKNGLQPKRAAVLQLDLINQLFFRRPFRLAPAASLLSPLFSQR